MQIIAFWQILLKKRMFPKCDFVYVGLHVSLWKFIRPTLLLVIST